MREPLKLLLLVLLFLNIGVRSVPGGRPGTDCMEGGTVTSQLAVAVVYAIATHTLAGLH